MEMVKSRGILVKMFQLLFITVLCCDLIITIVYIVDVRVMGGEIPELLWVMILCFGATAWTGLILVLFVFTRIARSITIFSEHDVYVLHENIKRSKQELTISYENIESISYVKFSIVSILSGNFSASGFLRIWYRADDDTIKSIDTTVTNPKIKAVEKNFGIKINRVKTLPISWTE